MKITEAYLTKPGKIELFHKELDKPLLNDELLIKVESCGICSSEFSVYKCETTGRPGVSFRYAKYPVSLGHESTGTVVDIGPECKRIKVGDKVTGVPYKGSSFATHIVEPESVMVSLPDSIDLEYALGEPLLCVANIVRMSKPDFEDFICIVGDGFMSLLTVAALSRYPLRGLVVVGHHDNRLKLAKEFGATNIVNSLKVDPYWEVRKLVDGPNYNPDQTPWYSGVDIAYDFAGNMASLQLCASLCKPKKRAKLMMPGAYGTEKFSIGEYLMNRAPSLIPCHPAHSMDIIDDLNRALIALEKGVFPIKKLITHKFSLDEIEIAFEIAMNQKDTYIKGIILPNQ